ncbi:MULTISPECIES: amidohydrolase family protein [unclassified Spirosoma]|uniref:amidohydrolase family protein n=1 Tax=unclassified Spirosoma TaxID=2621999 RepID=UPI000959CCA9|nr:MULTISPECIES: amidohydrolase family protein [unclassified Spirosoma]MBN8824960.1 amidohydrolase family protein [Spirosoma sp.]OJW74723.1 MAG: amidohydrolase [Spirosoma sp. 48-14]
MTIDSHQHFWHFDPVRDSWITDDMAVIQRDFLPADLEPVLKENGIDGCVAVQASQSEEETLFLVNMAQSYDIVKGVVGWVDLQSDQLNERLIALSAHSQIKGYRHVAQAEPDDFLARPTVIEGIRQLAKFGLTYDILIFPSQLKAALQLVRAVPEVNFVIDHIAKPYITKKEINRWSNYMTQLASQPNVSCKLSGMVTEADWHNWSKQDFFPYLDVVFEQFGPDRLLFGSDWPVCLVAANYTQVKTLIEEYVAPWGDEVRAKVFGANAVSFYRLT